MNGGTWIKGSFLRTARNYTRKHSNNIKLKNDQFLWINQITWVLSQANEKSQVILAKEVKKEAKIICTTPHRCGQFVCKIK